MGGPTRKAVKCEKHPFPYCPWRHVACPHHLTALDATWQVREEGTEGEALAAARYGCRLGGRGRTSHERETDGLQRVQVCEPRRRLPAARCAAVADAAVADARDRAGPVRRARALHKVFADERAGPLQGDCQGDANIRRRLRILPVRAPPSPPPLAACNALPTPPPLAACTAFLPPFLRFGMPYGSYLLRLSSTIKELGDVSSLWMREFYLELCKRVQFPISMSLPAILISHVLAAGNGPLMPMLLTAFDVRLLPTSNTAQHATSRDPARVCVSHVLCVTCVSHVTCVPRAVSVCSACCVCVCSTCCRLTRTPQTSPSPPTDSSTSLSRLRLRPTSSSTRCASQHLPRSPCRPHHIIHLLPPSLTFSLLLHSSNEQVLYSLSERIFAHYKARAAVALLAEHGLSADMPHDGEIASALGKCWYAPSHFPWPRAPRPHPPP